MMMRGAIPLLVVRFPFICIIMGTEMITQYAENGYPVKLTKESVYPKMITCEVLRNNRWFFCGYHYTHKEAAKTAREFIASNAEQDMYW
jgi:hypothetical protein